MYSTIPFVVPAADATEIMCSTRQKRTAETCSANPALAMTTVSYSNVEVCLAGKDRNSQGKSPGEFTGHTYVYNNNYCQTNLGNETQ